MNKYLGYSKEDLDKFEQRAALNKAECERAIERIKEKAKEEMSFHKKAIKGYEKEMIEIAEAKQYLKTHTAEYMYVIAVESKDEYKNVDGFKPKYVGDISGIKRYKAYKYELIKLNIRDSLLNPMNQNIEFASRTYLMDERTQLKEDIFGLAQRKKVKAVVLCNDVNLGTKELEKIGVDVYKIERSYY